jgi:hypothetical protein
VLRLYRDNLVGERGVVQVGAQTFFALCGQGVLTTEGLST